MMRPQRTVAFAAACAEGSSSSGAGSSSSGGSGSSHHAAVQHWLGPRPVPPAAAGSAAAPAPSHRHHGGTTPSQPACGSRGSPGGLLTAREVKELQTEVMRDIDAFFERIEAQQQREVSTANTPEARSAANTLQAREAVAAITTQESEVVGASSERATTGEAAAGEVPRPPTGMSLEQEQIARTVLLAAAGAAYQTRGGEARGVPVDLEAVGLRDFPLPSIGSIAHGIGTCRPCPFALSARGCNYGKACGMCHFHYGRRRRAPGNAGNAEAYHAPVRQAPE